MQDARCMMQDARCMMQDAEGRGAARRGGGRGRDDLIDDLHVLQMPLCACAVVQLGFLEGG